MNQSSKMKAKFLDKIAQVIFLDKEGFILESDHYLVDLSGYIHKHCSEVFPGLHPVSEIMENSPYKDAVLFPVAHEIAGNRGPFQLVGKKIKEPEGREAMVLILQRVRAPAETNNTMQATDEVFITSMSHKLRTPMNTILGFAELLKESSLTEDQSAYVNFISAAGENLLNLISDIVDYVKIDSGAYEIRENDFMLRETISAIIADHQCKAAEKDIRFYDILSPQLPDLVKGDQKMLTYVLQSLLTRAIRSTDSGFVEVMIKCRQGKKDLLVLEIIISDSGKAFSGEGIDIESTGLELALSGKLVKQNKGKIHVSGGGAGGHRYTVQLNFRTTESAESNDPALEDESWNTSFHDLKILLAEDIHINQILTEKILMKYGCNLEFAADGKKVIEKLKEKPYDLILMDLQMPEMDGYETTEYIRKKMPAAVKSIPIIALTAHVISGEKEKCLKSGMNDYLEKPFSSSQLCTKINSLVNKPAPISTSRIQSTIAMNLDFLRKTFKGNPSFLAKIIEGSMEDLPRYMSKLSGPVARKDFLKIVDIMIKLKSVFRLLGIYELAGLAHSIEKKAASNPVEQIDAIHKDIGSIKHWIPDITKQLMVELRKIESYN